MPGHDPHGERPARRVAARDAYPARHLLLPEDAHDRAREHPQRRGWHLLPARNPARHRRVRPPPQPERAPRRRAPVQRRGRLGRLGARHLGVRGYGHVLPVQGARLPRRRDALRPQGVHRRGAPGAEDARRRHATGGHHRRGRRVRAGAQRRPPCRRPRKRAVDRRGPRRGEMGVARPESRGDQHHLLRHTGARCGRGGEDARGRGHPLGLLGAEHHQVRDAPRHRAGRTRSRSRVSWGD